MLGGSERCCGDSLQQKRMSPQAFAVDPAFLLVSLLHKFCRQKNMTTSTGLAPSQGDGRSLLTSATQPSPAVTELTGTHSRHAFAQASPSTQNAQPCAIVAQKETGPHSPSELAFVSHQPPPTVINTPPRHTAFPRDNPSPSPALWRCSCSAWPRISVTCIIAHHTPAMEGSTGLDLTTSCQFQLWRTAVQESLRGYEGPSALVC